MWLVGELQRDIIDQIISGTGARNRLLYSAEGGGKTVLMGMIGWILVILAATAGVPGALGATAPTHPRLGTLVASLCSLGPVNSARTGFGHGTWGVLHADSNDIHTVSGHVIQCRSTKKQSDETGSPIQGWNWGLGALMDEIQDSISAYQDVVARLRSGKSPPIIGTATAKDSPTWRNWRDGLSDNWEIHRIRYTDTPFVHDAHWAMMQRECSKREWRRRGLALDVGPERMVYVPWSREKNLRPVPRVGAVDVTARGLSRFGEGYQVLIGHDPGSLQDCSILLKAYEFPGADRHVWFAVDELRTKQTTTEQHARELMVKLQTQYGLHQAPVVSAGLSSHRKGGKALVRCDPYGDNDSRTDLSVYHTFKRMGFDIRAAAYNKKGEGKGRVPKDAGIDMVCSLLCNAAGERRLFVAVDDQGRPLAPLLVEALELSERDEAGRAETQKKRNKGPGGDLSDFPAALRYALWGLERERGAAPVAEGFALG